MNIRDEGLGHCQKCGTPIMQTINKPGVKGVCFGCMADGEPKTGKTVVVTHEEGTGLDGRVTIETVPHDVKAASPVVATGPKTTVPIKPAKAGEVQVSVTLEELSKGDALIVLLNRLNDALDNMPFSTMKDAKLVMAIQAGIERKLSKLKGE